MIGQSFVAACWGVLLCVSTLTGTARGAAEAPERVPVLFDTDLGTGVDDAFALGLILASPELELRGVTTVGANAEDRAWMVCRFLTHAGRKDVPVAFGRDPQPKAEIDWQIQYRRHPAVVWDRTAKPVKETAVELMYRTLEADKGNVAIVAAGPLRNLAQLVTEKPDCLPWIGRVVVAGPRGAPPPGGDPDGWVLQQVARKAQVVEAAAPWGQLLEPQAERLFAAGTPVTYQVQALHELWNLPAPTLHSAFAVATLVQAPPGGRDKFLDWYDARVGGFGKQVLPKEPGNVSKLVERGGLPNKVHVFEDYETRIERRWWMTGKAEITAVAPVGPNVACRATLTQDYDDLQGDAAATYRAVVFNPVPGPPMGKNTRLSFRYKLKGTETIRVQLYSLSNGYHRYLSVKGLAENKEWQDATVDMTRMRRPDGTGGPLSEDERIDDIQFYIDPRAELLIDDVVLYDAAPPEEKRPFPTRFVFTGWFDTGEQGKEWPGDFEIVGHDKPLTWDAAKSVADKTTGDPWIRLHLRGLRPLPAKTELRFRYKLDGGTAMKVLLVNAATGKRIEREAASLKQGEWAETTLSFEAPAGAARDGITQVDEIQFLPPKGATLLVDDVLLYEPGE